MLAAPPAANRCPLRRDVRGHPLRDVGRPPDLARAAGLRHDPRLYAQQDHADTKQSFCCITLHVERWF